MGNIINKNIMVIMQLSKNDSGKKSILDIIGVEFYDYYYATVIKSPMEQSFIFVNVPEKKVKTTIDKISNYSFINIKVFKNRIPSEKWIIQNC